jgi:hypothetical protein
LHGTRLAARRRIDGGGREREKTMTRQRLPQVGPATIDDPDMAAGDPAGARASGDGRARRDASAAARK